MSTDRKSWQASYQSTRLTRRRLLGATASGAGAAALVACAGSNGPEALKLDDSGSNRTPGTVWLAKNDWKLADEAKNAVEGGIHRATVNVDQVPTSINPNKTAGYNNPIGTHIYQELIEVNRGPGIEPGSAAYSQVNGMLAESWEVSEDATRFTFTLRPNVRFHNIAPVNGRVMDIEDWKISYEAYTSEGAQYRLNFTDIVDHVEYPDARHMVLHMKYPYGPGQARWSSASRQDVFSILPKEVAGNDFVEPHQAIGTGFKVFDNHQPSIATEFRRNDQYWGGKVFIDRWHFPLVPEYANRYSQFVTGNVILLTPTSQDVLQVRRDAPDAVIVANEVTEAIQFMKFGRQDIDSAPWKDERVRIALFRSIDHEAIKRVQSNQQEFEAAGITIESRMQTHMRSDPNFWLDPTKDALGELSKNYFYDPAEAQKLMAAAGHGKEPVDIDLVYSDRSTGGQTDIYKVMTDSANRTGLFRWKPVAVANTEFTLRIINRLDFKGVHAHQSFGGQEPDFMYYRYFHSTAVNPPTFPDPKMDELAEAQRRTADQQKRWQVFKDTQLYLAKKFYTLPGPHSFTTFIAQWPWLHNSNQIGSKGNLQWLDAGMPRRNERA